MELASGNNNATLREARELVRSAIKSYFAPLNLLFDYARGEVRGSSTSNIRTERFVDELSFIQKAICYNQSALVEFCYFAAEKHKELKTFFKSDITSSDIPGLQRRSNDLLNFLNEEMLEVSLSNFQLLKSYFAPRSRVLPRICLKGNFNVTDGKNALIVSLFRDDPVGYDSNILVEGNTGFHYVRDHGRYFFENNIPQAVIDDAYVNPRLYDQQVRDEYQRSGRNFEHICHQWDHFWEGWLPKFDGDRSYYKSTLIIPLTFWNNELSTDFKKAVGIENVERTIFGYLCFDHRDIGFFNESSDVMVGYIFADILSVYIFNRLVYTTISKTYRNVNEALKGHQFESDIENIDTTLNRFRARREDILQSQSVKTVETKKNRLMSADKDLYDFVQSGK